MRGYQGFGRGSGEVSLFSPALYLVGVVSIGGFLLWRKKNKNRARISPSVQAVRNVIEEIEADDDSEDEDFDDEE